MTQRYSAANQLFHWVTVALMLAVLPLGWIAVAIPEDTKEFYFWLDAHKLAGLTILAVTVVRIGWRFVDRPPPPPAGMSAANRIAAHAVAGALMLLMVAMPLSGYVWTTGHGYDVDPFGWFRMPRLFFNDKPVGDAAKIVHTWGRWLVYALIVLHLAGVIWHLVWRRDRLLERMLPRQQG